MARSNRSNIRHLEGQVLYLSPLPVVLWEHDGITHSMQKTASIRNAAIAGMVGPLVLGGMIGILTVVQYDFLVELRWHPLRAPTTYWPSGLALGPYGELMVGTFVVSGLLLARFAVGLHRGIRGGSRSGPAWLVVAGGALMLLGFKTDVEYGGATRTLVGTIHDVAFSLLGVALLAALFALARRFGQDPAWRGHARYTVLTGILVAPAFLFKGIVFYAFLANVLVWFELTAWRLWWIALPKP
jgi:hypothetical protein